MDGKGRWVDNVIIERWFRSLKTEQIYPYEYLTPRALRVGIREYIEEYNTDRPHQSHGYMTVFGSKVEGLKVFLSFGMACHDPYTFKPRSLHMGSLN